MTLSEQLTKMLASEKEDDIIPFLKSLDDKQKKEIIPAIKNLHKYYNEFYNVPGTSTYRHRRTPPQHNILQAACFVCFNFKDFDQSHSLSILKKERLNEILPWYCPPWFNQLADKIGSELYAPHYFDYRWYMELVDQGYLQGNSQLIASVLSEAIYTRQAANYKVIYTPGTLLDRDITLKEHIWLLFKFETSIHHSSYRQFEDGSLPGDWLDAFKLYTDGGKIDRKRLLKEAVVAANGNFTPALSNWFMSLFAKLEPDKPELLQFAGELLNTLNSSNSKPVNIALDYFKKLASEPGFPAESFLEHVHLVLASPTKTAVTSALMVLEKLVKISAELSETICIAACQAFIHPDEKIQVRAAKLIQKYGDDGSAELIENISVYYDALLLEAKALLQAFIDVSGINQVESVLEDIPVTTQSLMEIPFPQTFDDFVFLASQAFDQNEPYHFDLLPAAILIFQGDITAANILKLAPAFQRAYKLVTGDWTSTGGYLDNLLAIFFIDYGQLLIKFYPKEAAPVREIRESFIKLEAERKVKSSNYTSRITGIKQWSVFTRTTGYKPHKHVLLNALFMLERKISLPLLSTPTHAPCYISSLILVQRMIAYQQANVIPGDMDLQIAVARCVRMKSQETLDLANESLKGENRQLISFIFGGRYYPQQGYKSKAAWLVAAQVHQADETSKEWLGYSKLSEKYLNADFSWSSGSEEYFYDQWDYKLRKNVKTKGIRSFIRVDYGEKERQTSVLKKVLNKLIPLQSEPALSIYDYTELKYRFISAEHNDIRRLLSINPHRPDLLIAYIINKCFYGADFYGENDKRLVTYTLETLLNFNNSYGGMVQLLIATCMISSDKTIRTYAAELWIKGVSVAAIDSLEIGTIIGTHEKSEFAPLKRFTDLILSGMYQVSPKHNLQLAGSIGSCIANMADKPINNTKKLLDIYAEVLSNCGDRTIRPETLSKLNVWQQTGSLEKSIQKIKKLVNVN